MSGTHNKKPRLRFWPELAKGSGIAVVIAIGVLAIAAALMSIGVLGREVERIVVISSVALGVMLGGMYVTTRRDHGCLLVGTGVGVAVFFLLLTAGVLGFGGMPGVGETVDSGLGCLLGGLLAGALPAMRRTKKRRVR